MFVTKSSRLAAVLLAAGLCAGCGGGARVTPPPSAAAAGAAGAAGPASLALRITVPSVASQATFMNRRSPAYLTSNVVSMTIAIGQGGTTLSTTTIGLQAGDPGCSPAPPVTCTATLNAPIGNDTFELTSLDASNQAISHAFVTRTIVAGVNTVPVTLNGIVASLAVIPGAPDYSIFEGATSKGTTQTATIVALDADNNVIVGAFDTPIAITADGTLFTVAGGSATLSTSADTFQYGYNLPDPYTGKATFTVNPAVYLAQPQIDDAKTLVAEANVGGIAQWYDFADADATQYTASGAQVSAWKDRNGGAATLSQSTLAAQPALQTGGFTHNPNQNTLQDLAFAAGTCLASASGFPSGSYSVFIAAIGTGSPGTLLGSYGTPSTLTHALTVPNAGEIDAVERGVTGPALTGLTLTAPNSYYLDEVVDTTGGSISLWFHGNPVLGPLTATYPAATGTPDPGLTVNGSSASCAGSAAGALGEVIVLDHAATASERLMLEEYLHRKWDI